MTMCLICREPAAVTITTEQGRFLAHYLACWDHIEAMCTRLRNDTGHPLPANDERALNEASRPRTAVINVHMLGNSATDDG